MASHTESSISLINQLEDLEKGKCNLPMIFTEMFKDEVNANDEQSMYYDIKKTVKKYAEDRSKMDIINKFTRVITGGASLEEILQITVDEALNPTAASELTVDNHCELS